MKKYIQAVLPAVGREKKRILLYNKIAVYQKEEYFAFCATDGHRLHISFTGGDLEYWTGREPLHLLDAKKVKKFLNAPIYTILEQCAVDTDPILDVWTTGVWEVLGTSTIPAEIQGLNFAADCKYLKDALMHPVYPKGGEVQVRLSGDALSPIVVSTFHYIALVMPMRSSDPWRFGECSKQDLENKFDF